MSKGEVVEIHRRVARQGRVEPLGEEITNAQPPAPGRYISLVLHIWVGDDGELIRGTIEDVHTGKRLAVDISALAALLRESLAHAPGHEENAQGEGEMTEERPEDS